MLCKKCKKERKITNDAIWQYLLDHSRTMANGYFHITLYMKDKKDFFARVNSRIRGYSRKDDVIEQEKRRNIENAILHARKRNEFFTKSKNPIDRFVGMIQRLLNKYKRSRHKHAQQYASKHVNKAKANMRWENKKKS